MRVPMSLRSVGRVESAAEELSSIGNLPFYLLFSSSFLALQPLPSHMAFYRNLAEQREARTDESRARHCRSTEVNGSQRRSTEVNSESKRSSIKVKEGYIFEVVQVRQHEPRVGSAMVS